MKNLLYKEFKLAIFPGAYAMTILSVLLLIPNYPYFIALMYAFITIPVTFVVCKDQKDIEFSVLLPVRKSDIVKARFISVIAIELLHIIVSIVFVIITNKLHPYGNSWLMDPNVAFFGLVFVMYAIFNTIFLTMFYKKAEKIAIPVTLSLTVTLIFTVLAEYFIQSIEILKTNLDTLNKDMLPSQLLVLAVGIIVFIVLNILSYKKSASNFEKIDI